MNEKQWWQSKTMWAGIVALVVGALGSTGLANIGGEQEAIVEKIMEIVTLAVGMITIYGRIKANSVIVKKPSPPAT